MPISCSIIYKSYTHLNIRGTQSLVGIEYACVFCGFICARTLERQRSTFNHGDFLVLRCTVLAGFSPSKKQRLWVPTMIPSCLWFSATFHFLWFCYFIVFLINCQLIFINLPKIGPVRYRLSMSDEFGKDWPSCNAIFTQ